MKLLLHLLLIVMMGSASSQSSLPACQGKEVNKWNNCFGFHVKNGDHMDYGFFTNSSKYVGEYKEGHIKGSKNIPLDTISSKIEEIKKLNKPVIACCRSGMRSAQATSILKQNGIEVLNGGGWESLQRKL